jgi:FtsZ-binding cell division protein ZapB
LEKQKEKAAMNAANYHAQLQEAKETIKLKDMEITELQKVIQDEKDQLKKQQNLYEQVRSDRNAYSKAQIQSEDEIAEVSDSIPTPTLLWPACADQCNQCCD